MDILFKEIDLKYLDYFVYMIEDPVGSHSLLREPYVSLPPHTALSELPSIYEQLCLMHEKLKDLI